jgi:hypothetical protein
MVVVAVMVRQTVQQEELRGLFLLAVALAERLAQAVMAVKMAVQALLLSDTQYKEKANGKRKSNAII